MFSCDATLFFRILGLYTKSIYSCSFEYWFQSSELSGSVSTFFHFEKCMES